ncbi:MAG: DUF3108 domain-containing protein [Bacteroidales bacterium]|jgi:hypothetical protein
MKWFVYILLTGILLGFDPGNNNRDKNQNEGRFSTFKEGEELEYTLKYGLIHGGDAKMSLNLVDYQDKKVYHARMHAKSAGITDKLFRVEDIYESYFDTGTCLPYKAVRNISEGGYKFYNEVYFSHSEGKLVSRKSGEYDVPPDILDVVSSLYYLRKKNLDTLKNGDVIPITTFFGDEIFPFPLRYKGIETVKTKLGKYKCHRFDPVVETGRIFNSEDDMTVWISADENMVPIRVKFDMIVGSLKCDLTKFKNLSSDLRRI